MKQIKTMIGKLASSLTFTFWTDILQTFNCPTCMCKSVISIISSLYTLFLHKITPNIQTRPKSQHYVIPRAVTKRRTLALTILLTSITITMRSLVSYKKLWESEVKSNPHISHCIISLKIILRIRFSFWSTATYMSYLHYCSIAQEQL
jgi:hypothetical protein